MKDFEQQYETMFPQVMRNVRRIIYDKDCAEDITQTTFLKAWESRDKYDETRGTLGAWLNTISTNLALQETEKRLTRQRFVDRLEVEMETFIPATQERESLAKRFKGKVERLSENDRNIVYLHVLEGVSFKTLGEMYGCSTDYIWKRFKKTIIKVRDM